MLRRLAPILLILTLIACDTAVAPLPEPEPDFVRAELKDTPGPVREWAENSRAMCIAHTKVYQGKRYILANYGECPTGGYKITIQDVQIDADKIRVTINYVKPGPDTPVPEVITYPQDLVYIADTNLPIEYRATGAEEYVSTLYNLDELRKITRESPMIKIFSPAPGASVNKRFTVEGVANVFEGAVSCRVLDSTGNPKEEKTVLAGMGDWYYFQADVEAPEDAGFTLELYTYSPKDGSIENLVQIPLKRKQAGD